MRWGRDRGRGGGEKVGSPVGAADIEPEVATALCGNRPAGLMALVPVLVGEKWKVSLVIQVIDPERDSEIDLISETEVGRITQGGVLKGGSVP